ncbi:MAG: hypothetical protein OXH10_02315 [bacterium]|nr:hypothetical protein [bacterium]MCY3580508.1 hypothetical protein [bacterium]MCY3651496.1 hypothetical protein [bacterium]
MKTVEYRDAARHLLAQGFAELEAGDRRQASEKGWGATAQMVKAVAEDRGWRHQTHAALFSVVNRIMKETEDEVIGKRFRSANALHQNFYEDWGSHRYVAGGLDEVRDLLDRLEPLLNGGFLKDRERGGV